MQTYYDLLGVPENASDSEIEAAFKSKAREVHPDRVPPGNPYLRKVASEAFKDLSEAKSVLLDHSERQKYDAGLAYMRGTTPSSTPPSPPPTPQSAPPPKAQANPRTQYQATPAPASQPTTGKYSFWEPTNTALGFTALAALGIGCLILLTGTGYPGLTLLSLGLALLCWRHGMRPGTDARILGGSIFLFIFAVIFFWGSIEPSSSNPKPSNLATGSGTPVTAVSPNKTAQTQSVGPTRLQSAPKNSTQVPPGLSIDRSSSIKTSRDPSTGRITFSNDEIHANNELLASRGPTPTIVNKTWKSLKDGQIYRSRLDGKILELESTNHYPNTDGDLVSCKFHRAMSVGLSWAGDCWERNPKDKSVYISNATITTFSERRMDMSTDDMVTFAMLDVDGGQNVSSQDTESNQAQRLPPSQPNRAPLREKVQTTAIQTSPHDLSNLSEFDRSSIESACSYHKRLNGPAAYYRCLDQKLAELAAVSALPDLSSVSTFEKQSIESACSYHKRLNGPAAYYRCVDQKVADLEAVSGPPDLSAVSAFEKQSIESACSYHKRLNGPAAYYRCVQAQLDLLRNSH